MEMSEQIRCIKLLMQRLDKDLNVDAGVIKKNPVTAYTSETRALAEWQSMFENYPQVMGLSADLPTPASFVTSNDLGKPILMTRDKEGQFHAFLNVCRHRGTVVESEARGQKTLFSCPFHAWAYSATGALMSVPKEAHFGAVDKSCNGLVELSAEEKHGLLWVHPKPGASFDLSTLLGDLGDELESWDLGKLEFAALDTYDTAMNWKLAIDTFGETYHFNVLHKNTLGKDLYANVQCYDTYERNHRMLLCAKSIDLLRDQAEENWNILLAAIPVYYLFPNIQLIPSGRRGDDGKGKLSGATLVRVYPRGDNPHESFSQISFYTNPEIPEDERMAISERLSGFSEIIRDEDYVAAETSHQGARSGATSHFIFGRNEPALHHYHNTYNQILGLAPLETLADD